MRFSYIVRIIIITLITLGIMLPALGCNTAFSCIKALRKRASTSDQVKVTVNTSGAANVGSLEFELVYDPSVLKPTGVEKGKLTDNAMIDFSVARSGRVWVAMIDSNGISGIGSLAVISFSNLQDKDASTTLKIENVYAYDATTLMDIVTSTTAGDQLISPSISFVR